MKPLKIELGGLVQRSSKQSYSSSSLSTIKIGTHWLTLAGIETGDEVSVSVEEGKLIIYKAKAL